MCNILVSIRRYNGLGAVYFLIKNKEETKNGFTISISNILTPPFLSKRKKKMDSITKHFLLKVETKISHTI